jgi:hypothetical protein
MDASACRVVYIDDRFNTERWLTREGLSTLTTPQKVSGDLNGLPPDLQANVQAVLSVFSQGTKCCYEFSIIDLSAYIFPLLSGTSSLTDFCP